MDAQKRKARQRLRRRHHVRSKIRGTPERPRLSVFRSCKHIYVQLIDDVNGVTLAAAGTVGKEMAGAVPQSSNQKAAEEVGKLIAERAKEKGVTRVCFDRGHYKYHGRVKALAEAARAGGLEF